jgi:hypothetical protein
MPRFAWWAAFAALLALGAVALAQRGTRRPPFGRGFQQRPFGRGAPQVAADDPFDRVATPREAEFHFIRVEYTDLPEYSRGYGYASRDGVGFGWWVVDWPAAENHFTAGIQRLTRLDTGDPRHFRLTDDRLFDYPWIYATQTGWWGLSDAETARLREYLLRGGYLVTDDFWSSDPNSWEVFRDTMKRTLPGQPISDIALDDPVMHVVYDIGQNDLTFIPGSRHLRRNFDGSATIVQPAGTQPAWRSIEDGKGHMVVAVNFNTDIGDAWEFADVPYYPEAMTRLAYRYAINYVMYAMTH